MHIFFTTIFTLLSLFCLETVASPAKRDSNQNYPDRPNTMERNAERNRTYPDRSYRDNVDDDSNPDDLDDSDQEDENANRPYSNPKPNYSDDSDQEDANMNRPNPNRNQNYPNKNKLGAIKTAREGGERGGDRGRTGRDRGDGRDRSNWDRGNRRGYNRDYGDEDFDSEYIEEDNASSEIDEPDQEYLEQEDVNVGRSYSDRNNRQPRRN